MTKKQITALKKAFTIILMAHDLSEVMGGQKRCHLRNLYMAIFHELRRSNPKRKKVDRLMKKVYVRLNKLKP